MGVGKDQDEDVRRDSKTEVPLICGIDEAGRGPLAGPVYAAAVILPRDFPVDILDDSKKLSVKKREYAAAIIYAKALFWGIGTATVNEIDTINIREASLLAMSRAFDNMYEKMNADFEGTVGKIEIIVDGNAVPVIRQKYFDIRSMVKADAKIHAVMAASILAKTARDSEMLKLSKLYPEYGYEKHKGYGTKFHYEMIKKYGPSVIQRKSFTIREVY